MESTGVVRKMVVIPSTKKRSYTLTLANKHGSITHYAWDKSRHYYFNTRDFSILTYELLHDKIIEQ